jgi:hypothetical protein
MEEPVTNRVLEIDTTSRDELIALTRQDHPSPDMLHQLFGEPAFLSEAEVAEIGIRAVSWAYEVCVHDMYAGNLVRVQELFTVEGVGRMAIRANDFVTLDSTYQRLEAIGGWGARRRRKVLTNYVQTFQNPRSQ